MLDFQDAERDVFRRMEIKDQSMALFDMLRYVRSEIAGTKRLVIEMQEDIKTYRVHREQSEEGTTQKIENALNKRFDLGIYMRDKIIPPVLTMIVIALLYLAFQSP